MAGPEHLSRPHVVLFAKAADISQLERNGLARQNAMALGGIRRLLLRQRSRVPKDQSFCCKQATNRRLLSRLGLSRKVIGLQDYAIIKDHLFYEELVVRRRCSQD